ncbi:protein kinase, partial [Acidobacteriota bacterium]
GKSITGSGIMIGTPQYMSPEQVEGKDVDQRSDIYSLGIILYEMLTDRVPFEGDTPLTVGVKQKTETPKDPKDFNERIPGDLNQLILKCLEKEKENRYQSPDELRSDLEKLEQGLPTTDRVIPKKKTLTSKEVTVTFKKRWAWIAVPLVIILAAILAFLLLTKGKERPLQSPHKIIVLPFKNLGQAENENFAVGISDGIRMRLSKLHNLKVIASDTAASYKDTQKTSRQIRNETKADYILSGTVSRIVKEGEISKVRIRPELKQSLDDSVEWADEIDQEIQDLFSAESEISEQVSRQLGLILQPKEIQAIEVRPTENPEAWQSYLHGQNYWRNRLFERDLQLAIQMFERAVVLDPEFALANCYLSMCHSLMSHLGYDMSDERKSMAKAAVDRVRELQPELPELHSALGTYYYWSLKDYDRALAELSIAEKDLPNDAVIPEMIGNIRRRQGDYREHIRLSKKSLELNPKDITTVLSIGGSELALRNFPEAEYYFDLAISLDPTNVGGYAYKALTYLFWSWDIEKASAVIESMPLSKDSNGFIMRCLIEMVKGDHQAALDILSTASFEIYTTPVSIFLKAEKEGRIYAAMGKKDLARASFDSARLLLEAEVIKSPQDPRIRSLLSFIYAALDRKDDALREGYEAMKICPVSMDANVGPQLVNNFAEVLVMLGEYDDALDKIDYLLEIPFIHLSVASFQNSPEWKPLREHPRFKQIVRKHSR